MLFDRFLRRRPNTDTCRHSIPPGQRIYAIGDVHGRLDLLDELIARIVADEDHRGPAETTLVFLGDLVDRGPDSRGVIERIMDLRQRRSVRLLRGNHDDVFQNAVTGDVKATRFLVRIGGRPTILSYGISEDEYLEASFEQLTDWLGAQVPSGHIDFLKSFEQWIVIGDYLLVHAGIRPGVELKHQTTQDLCWIREEFLSDCRDHGKMVIHGHSIREEVDLRENRIGIDTGAYRSGHLTAIGLEGLQRWFIST